MSVDHSLLGLATCKVQFKNATTTIRQLHLEIFWTCVLPRPIWPLDVCSFLGTLEIFNENSHNLCSAIMFKVSQSNPGVWGANYIEDFMKVGKLGLNYCPKYNRNCVQIVPKRH